MKTLEQYAGETRSQKYKSNEYAAKYWGALSVQTGRKFERSDGSIGVDKTRGFHSRPHKKQELRNAARAQNKRGRQLLKQNMQQELLES